MYKITIFVKTIYIMNKDLNYDLLPYKFAHCMNSRCKRADECLRYKAMQHIPAERKTVTIVTPACTNPANGDCSFFSVSS